MRLIKTIFVAIIALLMVGGISWAQNSNNITTWQASPGYVNSIQSQLNALSAQLPTSAGTAGQALFTSAGLLPGWVTFSGDFTCSTVTPGLCTIASISTNVNDVTGAGDNLTGPNVNNEVTPLSFGDAHTTSVLA